MNVFKNNDNWVLIQHMAYEAKGFRSRGRPKRRSQADARIADRTMQNRDW